MARIVLVSITLPVPSPGGSVCNYKWWISHPCSGAPWQKESYCDIQTILHFQDPFNSFFVLWKCIKRWYNLIVTRASLGFTLLAHYVGCLLFTPEIQVHFPHPPLVFHMLWFTLSMETSFRTGQVDASCHLCLDRQQHWTENFHNLCVVLLREDVWYVAYAQSPSGGLVQGLLWGSTAGKCNIQLGPKWLTTLIKMSKNYCMK